MSLLAAYHCYKFDCYISLHDSREGARVMWGYVNRILGQPSLIRESSMAKFPWSGIATRGIQKFSSLGNSASVENKHKFGNIILHPSLQRRIEHIARATANTKSHQAPFRNMLFYGPPGTGKTLVAREIARKSVCLRNKLKIFDVSKFYSAKPSRSLAMLSLSSVDHNSRWQILSIYLWLG